MRISLFVNVKPQAVLCWMTTSVPLTTCNTYSDAGIILKINILLLNCNLDRVILKNCNASRNLGVRIDNQHTIPIRIPLYNTNRFFEMCLRDDSCRMWVQTHFYVRSFLRILDKILTKLVLYFLCPSSTNLICVTALSELWFVIKL